MSERRLSLALAGVSASLLAFELLLMRLFSLAEWGHLAGFIISIAMLGLAAAGLLLHFQRRWVQRQPLLWFSCSAGSFGMAAPAAFAATQAIPFTPFLLVWSGREYVHLAGRILLLFLPFFASGIALGAFFVAKVLPARRLYFSSMLGAALAGPALASGMGWLHPLHLLAPTALLALASATLTTSSRRGSIGWLSVGLGACLWILFMPFHYSPYKDLAKTLTLPNTRLLQTRWSPKGLVQTVYSPSTRYLPGLSLNFTGDLPPAHLVFVDGSNMELVFDPRQALAQPEFLLATPEALAYQLHPQPSVLLLGGNTTDCLRALAAGARDIVWTDDLPARHQARESVWSQTGSFPFPPSSVVLAAQEPRHFLQSTSAKFDLIHFSLLGSHGAASAGAASLDPSFTLTREGFSLLFQRLAPQGQAVLTTWIENPPRAGPRLASLLIETLRQQGLAHPAQHLLALRSWATVSFLVSPHPYDAVAIDQLKSFAECHSFDLVHYPGMTPSEANRYNEIPGAPYFTAIVTLLHSPSQLLARRTTFHIRAPTDDRPFFSHYFRWRTVPWLISSLGRDWLPYVEWGYLLQTASLVLGLLLGFFMLVLPCSFTRARPALGTNALFFALGVAYMLVELWAIYRLTYFLCSPLLASTTTLTAMLAASGAGALVLNRPSPQTTPPLQKAGALLLALLVAWTSFQLCHAWLFPLPLPGRICLATLWIALPAFFMGFPYPFALDHIRRPEDIPWALAWNGFGSVLGSLAAVLVAVHFGLTALAWTAIGFYSLVAALLIAWTFPRPTQPEPTRTALP